MSGGTDNPVLAARVVDGGRVAPLGENHEGGLERRLERGVVEALPGALRSGRDPLGAGAR
jgi:hypothetical protein